MAKQTKIDLIEATPEVLDAIAPSFDLGLKVIDGTTYGQYKTCCPRCGGRGYGHWYQDGGVCYGCGGTGGHGSRLQKLTKKNGTLTRDTARQFLPHIAPELHAELLHAERTAAVREKKSRIRRAIETGDLTREDLDALRVMRGTEFGDSLRAAVLTYGHLTDNQSAAIIKAAARKVESAARREAEEAAAAPAPEGRVTIAGRIVSVKLRESIYGCAWKALLVCTDENGGVFKVYMTLTDTAIDAIAPSVEEMPDNTGWADRVKATTGRTIRCAVTLTRSDDDESFAFGKRPAKFELVASE